MNEETEKKAITEGQAPQQGCLPNYEWVADYMGKSFLSGAYGPDKFDCYGLVWHANKNHNGRELPRFDDIDYQMKRINAEITEQTLSEDWREVTIPEEFDCVVMRRAGEAYHVGLWLNVDGGKVLHATPEGILCNDLRSIHLMNFRHVAFYRYVFDRVSEPI